MEINTPPKIHTYAYHIFRAWYNGSYTIAAKSNKFLELYYTMTQFLIISDIPRYFSWGIISHVTNLDQGRASKNI